MPNPITTYFLEAKAELKKVAWPTKKETTKHTLLVIGISLGVAAVLGAVDYVFSLGFEKLIAR
ncbi:MAG: preprotein translocase subunit SecE [Patescibacteria group bacterium]|jgi:preprotein translocase subunit SecE